MQLATVDTRKAKSPAWLEYIVGAFAHANITAVTIFVMKSQFADTDADTMLEAVKAYVENEEYWPSVAKLKKYAARVQLSQHMRGPLWKWHKEWAADNWTLCSGPCGELTPNINACPFCEDMRVTP